MEFTTDHYWIYNLNGRNFCYAHVELTIKAQQVNDWEIVKISYHPQYPKLGNPVKIPRDNIFFGMIKDDLENCESFRTRINNELV